MNVSCKLSIKNNFEYLQYVSSLIESIAISLGLNEEETFKIKFATEETLTNNIASSFEENEIAEIEIVINQISSGIEVIIRDKGLPFNPFRKKEIDQPVTYDITREELSNKLIHKLVDKVYYNNLGKLGKEAKLYLYSQNNRINNLLDKNEKQTDKTTDDIYDKVRLFEIDDAYEISKLFYKSYGYSYVNEIVYFPDRILHNIKIGKMHSAVSVSKQNKIIGHIALFEPDNSCMITEWGMAVSDPVYRGQGIMNNNVEFIIKHAEDLGYKGMFAHSVTNHNFTQKTCSKYNFTTCGLLIGYAPDLSFKGINSELTQRESTFIEFKYFNPSQIVSLFTPIKYKDIITNIYDSLGVSLHNLTIREHCSCENEERISENLVSALNSVDIVAYKMNKNSILEIKKMTKQYSTSKVDNIFLFLNMEDEFSMSQTEKLESLGYIFVGIFPDFVFSHTIIFQYINNIKYDYNKIVAYSEIATKLKSIVQSSDQNQI